MLVIILFILIIILCHEICPSSWQVLVTDELKKASELGQN